MSVLSEIIDRVEADLKDTSNATWSADDLTRAVRWALHELSWATPRRAVATLIAEQGVREYSLSAGGIGDVLFVTEVWYPYDAADQGYPPRAVPWRLLDDDTLYLDLAGVTGGEGIRLFYARAHTVEGLDDATATTLTREQEELVCLGAAGYAALQRAQESIGQVNLTGQAPLLWRDWGQARLYEFRNRLNQLARREMQWRVAWTEGWAGDR
ncbi:MAG: hypothetical protein QME94_08515 [Anaerolineae bacterium]|nr:hypothetical protein [Anaerolineae bacterium]